MLSPEDEELFIFTEAEGMEVWGDVIGEAYITKRVLDLKRYRLEADGYIGDVGPSLTLPLEGKATATNQGGGSIIPAQIRIQSQQPPSPTETRSTGDVIHTDNVNVAQKQCPPHDSPTRTPSQPPSSLKE